MSYREDLARIHRGLQAAVEVFRDFTPGSVEVTIKEGGDPVTEADRKVNDLLLSILPRSGEGWLSEETVDSDNRADKRRVWIVDPLDGTREFVAGIPEWCVSIGLVEDGRPVAGGILNPVTGETFLGALGMGVTLDGDAVKVTDAADLDDAVVLASRSETKRGEWERFSHLHLRPVGSVAYKLALVAAGKADATWTLVPKNEWDVAAGVALVTAAGGFALEPSWQVREFNQTSPLLPGLVTAGPNLLEALKRELPPTRGA